jgi:hypothetical protein
MYKATRTGATACKQQGGKKSDGLVVPRKVFSIDSGID